MKATICIILVILFLTSCSLVGEMTFTKRKFRKGYYLETPSLVDKLLKNTSKRNNSPILEKKQLLNDTSENYLASTDILFIPQQRFRDETLLLNKIVDSPPDTIKSKTDSINQISSIDSLIKPDTITAVNKSTISDDRKVHPLAIISLLSSIILPIIAVILCYTIAGGAIVVIPALLLPVIGIALGFVSLKKIKKQPDKYRGKGASLAAIILGFSFYLLLLAFLIFVIVALSTMTISVL
jgi:hypothetical protein